MAGDGSAPAADPLRGPTTGPMGYVPELDGLRAISVMLVVAFHTLGGAAKGGFIGVDVFFVLSGYLITRILVNEFGATGRIDLKGFYIRRFLRLMPALWLLLAFTLGLAALAALLHRPDRAQGFLIEVLYAGAYFTNWARAFDMPPEGILTHTWSLAIEEQFYFVWPLLLLAILGRAGKAHAWKLVAALLAASIAWRLVLVLGGASVARVYNGFDTRAETLLWGCLLATAPWQALRPVLNRLWPVPVLALAACVVALDYHSDFEALYGYSLAAACAAWIIAVVTDARSRGPVPVLSSRPMVFVGRISYGVYLWHFPICYFIGEHVPWWANVAITTGGAIGLAAASYYWVEVRALRLKGRFTRKPVAAVAV